MTAHQPLTEKELADKHPAVGDYDEIGCATHGRPLIKCLRQDLFAATADLRAAQMERDLARAEVERLKPLLELALGSSGEMKRRAEQAEKELVEDRRAGQIVSTRLLSTSRELAGVSKDLDQALKRATEWRAEATKAEQKVAEFQKEKAMILREDAEDKKDLDRTVALQAKTIEALREMLRWAMDERVEEALTARKGEYKEEFVEEEKRKEEAARVLLKEVGK
jgi:chromosome segregation ATPase